MLCVCKDGKRKYQSLGVSIKAEQWDFKANINEKITEIQKAALDKRTLCKGIGSEYFQGYAKSK